MSTQKQSNPAVVGIIANPISARDIRRVVTNASNIQTTERVNIILRLLSTLAACGVESTMLMPDRSGICSMLLRHLEGAARQGNSMPALDIVEMDVNQNVEDTLCATRAMQEARVDAIVVLGGDGTHRAVISELMRGCARGLPNIPIAGLSTGTNNAFPEMREPTIAGMAVGLYAVGKLDETQALSDNKILDVSINDGERKDIAIVDALISPDRFIGARAIWKTASMHSVYLAFADPEAIGFSAIGGLLQPTPRSLSGGLKISLASFEQDQKFQLLAPIAPGLLTHVGIKHYQPMLANEPFVVDLPAGVVALDGEREMTFTEDDVVSITLRENAFRTVDIPRCMQIAAHEELLRHTLHSHQ